MPRTFRSSGRFRLNANSGKLNAWLIYRCTVRDDTWPRLDRDQPWTAALLDRIEQRDGTTADEIAAALGIDKVKLTRRIRQLEEPGLTESLKASYRLSKGGRAAQSKRGRPTKSNPMSRSTGQRHTVASRGKSK